MLSEVQLFNTVPKEILVKIFEYTHETDQLKRMSLVCKRWRDAIDQTCLSFLWSFNLNCKKSESRKHVIGSVRFFCKLLESDPESPILNKVNATLASSLTSIFELRNLNAAFSKQTVNREHPTQRCYHSLNLVLNKIERHFPSATFLKAILINTYGNLLLSAQHNCLNSLQFHLAKGTPTQTEIQKSLLTACVNGNYKIAKLLIEHKADPKMPKVPGESETYLTAACRRNNLNLVNLLVNEGAHTTEENNMGLIPLAIAARVNVKIFNLLANFAPSLSSTHGNHEQNTLAHFAADGNNPEVILSMVSDNAPIDEPNISGVTPLMRAIRSGSYITVLELIECGASIQSACNKNWTPLDYAIEEDQQKCIDLILSRNPGRMLLINSLKLAISYKNVMAIRKISTSLGVTPAVKYGTILAAGTAIGMVAMKFFAGSSE